MSRFSERLRRHFILDAREQQALARLMMPDTPHVAKDGSVETPLGLGGWLLQLALHGGLTGALKNLGNAGATITAL